LIELTAGLIFLTILFPVYFHFQPALKYIPTPADFIYLLILSLVCTVLTWILSLQALRKVSAYTMGLALNLEPIYGIILAILFAGEGRLMNRGFVMGASIIFLTVLIHTVYKSRSLRKSKKNDYFGPLMD
jgi:drug/metabolite transporter (DMT)-like permease